MNPMSLFANNGNVPQQPQQQQPQQESRPFVPSDNTPPPQQPTQGQQQQQHNAADPGQHPLDAFAEMFKVQENADAQDPDSPWIKYDQEAFNTQLSQMQMPITEQMQTAMQAAASGDVNAFQEVLQHMYRAAVGDTLKHSAQLSEQVGRHSLGLMRSELPNHLRDSASTAAIQSTHQAMSHPAVKPVVDNLRRQILAKYPEASPEEVATQVTSYLQAMSEAFRPAPAGQPAGQPQAASVSTDFGNFFG